MAATDLLLSMPVLDGPDPKQWEIWSMKFEEACKVFYQGPRGAAGMLPDDDSVRLSILLEAENDLFNRTDQQWGAVIGLLVDGSSVAADPDAMFERVVKIATKVRSGNAFYKRLKEFKVCILLADDTAAVNTQIGNFQRKVELELKERLGVVTDADTLINVGEFRGFLRSFERRLVRYCVVNGDQS